MSAADVASGAYLVVGLGLGALLWAVLRGDLVFSPCGDPDCPDCSDPTDIVVRRWLDDAAKSTRRALDSPQGGWVALFLTLMIVATVALGPAALVVLLARCCRRRCHGWARRACGLVSRWVWLHRRGGP